MMQNQQQNKDVNAQGNPQQPQPPKIKIGYIIFGYMIINAIMGFFKSPGDPKLDKNLIGNIVKPGEKFDLEIAINKDDKDLYIWNQQNITYDYSSENLRMHNFTLTADELFTQPYPVMTISLSSQERELVLYNETDIVFKKELKLQQEKKNLLFGETPGDQIIEEERQKEDEELEQLLKKEKQYAPHYRSRVYAFFVKDDNAYNRFQMPPPFNTMEIEIIDGARYYKPFIDTTNWWLREVDYLPQNKTMAFLKQQKHREDKDQAGTQEEIKELQKKTENEEHFDIEVYFDTYWSFKFMMQNQMMQSNKMYQDMGVDMEEDGTWDILKEMLVENSPYYLAVTMIVSTLHSLFEFLAMKNDVMFWRNLQNHQGLSLRSLYTNFFMDIIIFLYLVDSEETSYMILIPSLIEIFITVWKILKTSVFRKSEKFPYFKIEPRQRIYCETTEKYDKTAVKWMYILLLPFFVGYLIYSLYNNEHKGWYSFILNSIVGFIYIFGFINMTPQLYINYKLKSVDHLPWRTMIYKFLNTIVDDFFAFAISQPWLKRLSCFRDDIIFVIYIYQRWIYRVDPRRTRYGFVKDELVPTNAPPNQSGETETEKEKTD